MDQDMLKALNAEIEKVVDRWVSETLKERLISGTDNPQKRTLWDRLKQGISNWWYGPQGEKENPYRWKNRFGHALGSMKESFDPTIFTLVEYSEIRGLVDSVERAFNESGESFEGLRLTQILTSAAKDLKAKLFDALKNKLTAMAAPAEPAPKPTPAEEPKPPAPPAEEPSPPAAPPTKRPVSQMKKGNKDSKPTRPSSAPKSSSSKKAAEAKSEKPARAARETEDTTKDRGETGNQTNNEALAGFLQDDKVGRYEIKDAIGRITKFFLSADVFRTNSKFKEWWVPKAQEYIRNQEGDKKAFDRLWEDLVASDSIVEDASRIAGVSKDDIKRMMKDHLESFESKPEDD